MEAAAVIMMVMGGTFAGAVVTGAVVYRRLHRKVTFMLDALEDGENSFRYQESKLPGRRFNRTLNRLHGIYDAEIRNMREQEAHYGRMLDTIRTGIIVVDMTGSGKGSILWSNAAASAILGLPSLSHLRQLAVISAGLKEAFENIGIRKEDRVSFNNERSKVVLSLTANESVINGREVSIIAFNDISGDLVHNEEISWNRLIRVLTHEIMNTVTPIASLSETLGRDLENAGADGSGLDLCELRQGLDTISSSSRSLVKFVDVYRNLTRVAPPVKKAFYVRELVDRVRVLTAEKLEESGARMEYEEKSEDILIYADSGQISQIMVNLVKNAVQAGATRVKIEASIDYSEKVVVRIANNGMPISPESTDEIFVPFYTTKQDGSGIGLSLSRQIMRQHNGSIHLERSDERMTVFVLQFN